ncbi:MAG: 1-acyl-sn-glycerol-3-phosphate acyltransferase, partial [Bacteroidota bacterium]
FSTLDYCFEALSQHKPILIMAEGHCVQEKRLQPMKKGPARLAFGTYQRFGDLDIQIVPVGVSYTYPDEFRSEVMMEFGRPIAVREYLQLYDENPPEAIRQITQEIGTRLSELIVIIDKEEAEELVEGLLVMHRNDHPEQVWPVFSEDNTRLIAERAIAERVNEMPLAKRQALQTAVRDYFQTLANYKIDDRVIAQLHPDTFDRSLVLLVGFLPFLLGYVFNYLPMWLAVQVGKKVKDQEDRMSIVITAAIIFYLLYYTLFLVVAAVVHYLLLWLFVLLLPVWGYFSLLYLEYYEKWKKERCLAKLDPDTVAQLRKERSALYAFT